MTRRPTSLFPERERTLDGLTLLFAVVALLIVAAAVGFASCARINVSALADGVGTNCGGGGVRDR